MSRLFASSGGRDRHAPTMKILRGCILATFVVVSLARAQLTFTFDYSKDSSNFFVGHADRQATLNAAASYLSGFLTGETLSAVTPGGANGLNWTSTQPDPSTTGSNFTLNNSTIAANTVVIYVGAVDLTTPNQIAFGTQGSWTWGWTSGGSAVGEAWRDTVFTRGLSSTLMAPKVGSISFDSLTPWYFDNDVTTVENFSGSYDFFSVAVHELTHILGEFNGSASTQTSPTNKTYSYGWTNNISGSNFVGTNATTEYGGPAPLLVSDLDHWAEGTQSVIAGNDAAGTTAQEALMDPTFNLGVRKYLTELDVAGLQDIGYTTNSSTLQVNISAVPEPSTYALFLGLGVLGWIGLGRRRQP